MVVRSTLHPLAGLKDISGGYDRLQPLEENRVG